MKELEMHRTAKMFLDNKKAASPEEALSFLESASIAIAVGDEVQVTHNMQVALLTAINAGKRTFVGGVYVLGNFGNAIVLPDVPGPRHLARTVEFYGGTLEPPTSKDIPLIVIGNTGMPEGWKGPVIRITWRQWCASVTSDIEAGKLDDDDAFAPAAVHAAAMGIAECFQSTFLNNLMATRRTWTISLYRPDFKQTPLDMPGPNGPVLLPSRLWLIGLGHLGQAYLWNLLCMKYPHGQRPEVTLQDTDVISEATLSTGLLAFTPALGRPKTREMCSILESAGFQVRLVERRFDGQMKIQEKDPLRALSGLDNLEDRAVLDTVGFKEIIDAGLGAGPDTFMNFQIRTFPSTKAAKEVLEREQQGNETEKSLEALIAGEAYRGLETQAGRCGMIEVAKKAVGAPFVGGAVASLVIAEAVRSSMANEPRFYGISGTLKGPEALDTSVKINPPAHNLGYIASL